jgi:hydroxymethylpyrimidine pyrophosphatase-like HAD family hydrolase
MAVRLILSDIDGCITPEESAAWDWERFSRFVGLVRDASAGRSALAPMTLCTGRPQPYVEALMKVLDIRFASICESGAILYSLHDNCSRLAPEVTPDRVRGLQALRNHIVTEIFPDFPGLVYQCGKEAQMSLYCGRPECFPEVERRVAAHAATIPGLEVIITPSHYYLNIDLPGVTKGGAIRTVLGGLGISREEAAGMGDTLGDLSIREEVGFFACPSNAVDALKRVADYVSPYPNIEGMLDILKRPELHRA